MAIQWGNIYAINQINCLKIHNQIAMYHIFNIKVLLTANNIWWLCLVPTSTTRFTSEVGPKFNSLTPRRFQFNIRKVIFKLTLVNGGWGISYEIALRWMPQDLTDDKSTLVQVMAWCSQATSHYLSQCWPRSMSPNGVTRPQWVK